MSEGRQDGTYLDITLSLKGETRKTIEERRSLAVAGVRKSNCRSLNPSRSQNQLDLAVVSGIESTKTTQYSGPTSMQSDLLLQLTPWSSGRPFCFKRTLLDQCNSRRHQKRPQQQYYFFKVLFVCFEAPFSEEGAPLNLFGCVVVKIFGQCERRVRRELRLAALECRFDRA